MTSTTNHAEIPTPRTDNETRDAGDFVTTMPVVTRHFARQLERELRTERARYESQEGTIEALRESNRVMRGALYNMRVSAIPGMNWTCEIGRALLAEADSALASTPSAMAAKLAELEEENRMMRLVLESLPCETSGRLCFQECERCKEVRNARKVLAARSQSAQPEAKA